MPTAADLDQEKILAFKESNQLQSLAWDKTGWLTDENLDELALSAGLRQADYMLIGNQSGGYQHIANSLKPILKLALEYKIRECLRAKAKAKANEDLIKRIQELTEQINTYTDKVEKKPEEEHVSQEEHESQLVALSEEIIKSYTEILHTLDIDKSHIESYKEALIEQHPNVEGGVMLATLASSLNLEIKEKPSHTQHIIINLGASQNKEARSDAGIHFVRATVTIDESNPLSCKFEYDDSYGHRPSKELTADIERVFTAGVAFTYNTTCIQNDGSSCGRYAIMSLLNKCRGGLKDVPQKTFVPYQTAAGQAALRKIQEARLQAQRRVEEEKVRAAAQKEEADLTARRLAHQANLPGVRRAEAEKKAAGAAELARSLREKGKELEKILKEENPNNVEFADKLTKLLTIGNDAEIIRAWEELSGTELLGEAKIEGKVTGIHTLDTLKVREALKKEQKSLAKEESKKAAEAVILAKEVSIKAAEAAIRRGEDEKQKAAAGQAQKLYDDLYKVISGAGDAKAKEARINEILKKAESKQVSKLSFDEFVKTKTNKGDDFLKLIEHQEKRFEFLSKYLEQGKKQGKRAVVIAGKDGHHSLGVGLALDQWGKGNENLAALNIMHLYYLTQNLKTQYGDLVSFDWVGDGCSAEALHVWGANTGNFTGEEGTRISGGGQAEKFTVHKAGVFGVVSTPFKDPTFLRIEKVDTIHQALIDVAKTPPAAPPPAPQPPAAPAAAPAAAPPAAPPPAPPPAKKEPKLSLKIEAGFAKEAQPYENTTFVKTMCDAIENEKSAMRLDNTKWKKQISTENLQVKILENINSAMKKLDRKAGLNEFVPIVIRFAQEAGGVGNAGEEQWNEFIGLDGNNIPEGFSFLDAKKFSYHYQEAAKESGIYTGRTENLKNTVEPIGARLKRIPEELNGFITKNIGKGRGL